MSALVSDNGHVTKSTYEHDQNAEARLPALQGNKKARKNPDKCIKPS